MADESMVPLTELGVITRWSLAVRQGQVSRDELIATLRDDLEFLESVGDTDVPDDAPPVAAARPESAPPRSVPRRAGKLPPPNTDRVPAKPAATKVPSLKPAPRPGVRRAPSDG